MVIRYLDWASTALPDAKSFSAFASSAFDFPANPSSIHPYGRSAREHIELSRKSVSDAVDLGPSGFLVFTSGGTESNLLVISSYISKRSPFSVVSTSIEHPSVFRALKTLESFGAKIRFVDPEPDGIVDPSKFVQAMDTSTSLAIMMAVNNETGAIQKIGEASELAKKSGFSRVRFHCDAVQALGKIRFSFNESGAHSASFSAHKIGAPRGVGALALVSRIEPLFPSGAQENGIRGGTENGAGIAAFASSCTSLGSVDAALMKARALSDSLIDAVRSSDGISVIPHVRTEGDDRYSPWIVSLSAKGVPSEVMVRALSDEGIFVSAGSACSSTKKERRVLSAMGMSDSESSSAIRVSFGPSTTRDDIDAFVETLQLLTKRLSV